jgi:uncharacterized membrane protein YoaK (UPF0700 family)
VTTSACPGPQLADGRETDMSAAFLSDVRDTVVPDPGGRHGPLPPLLVSMTLVTGHHEHRARLHSFAGAVQGAFLAVSVVLAIVGGGAPAAGYRYTLIAVLGIAMGVQNAAARAIAVPDLTTTVLTLTITGIAADSALAGGPGSKAGRRLVPVVTMLVGGLLGAVLIRHAQGYDALIIALVTIIAGAAVSHRAGRADPGWVHAHG